MCLATSMRQLHPCDTSARLSSSTAFIKCTREQFCISKNCNAITSAKSRGTWLTLFKLERHSLHIKQQMSFSLVDREFQTSTILKGFRSRKAQSGCRAHRFWPLHKCMHMTHSAFAQTVVRETILQVSNNLLLTSAAQKLSEMENDNVWLISCLWHSQLAPLLIQLLQALCLGHVPIIRICTQWALTASHSWVSCGCATLLSQFLLAGLLSVH